MLGEKKRRRLGAVSWHRFAAPSAREIVRWVKKNCYIFKNGVASRRRFSSAASQCHFAALYDKKYARLYHSAAAAPAALGIKNISIYALINMLVYLANTGAAAGDCRSWTNMIKKKFLTKIY